MKLISLILLFILSTSLSAQTEMGELILGETHQVTMDTSSGHSWTIELSQDQFVIVQVMQSGVDVFINLVDPTEEQVGYFDSPNGRQGAENIDFTTETEGSYKLELVPFNELYFAGDYEISVLLAEPVATTTEGRVDQLFTLYDNHDTPGAAVAVVQQGEVIYSNGYGMANLEHSIPIDPTTKFQIASVSKQFTAFSIALLEQDGLLDVDDDIRNYLPEMPDFGDTITLRHMINHTSGLRTSEGLLALAGSSFNNDISNDQLLKIMSKQQDLNFKPGEEYLYCNSAYTLLSIIVERVSGMTFHEFTQERIFEPIGMTDTRFADDAGIIFENRSYPYAPTTDGYRRDILNFSGTGATNLYTTVLDLAKWARNFEVPVAGNEETMQVMRQRGILNNGDTIKYAWGQGLSWDKGVLNITHTGAHAGYKTVLIRYPDHETSVIVLSNDRSFNSNKMGRAVADLYMEEYYVIPDEEELEEVEEEPLLDEEETLEMTPDDFLGVFNSEELSSTFTIVLRDDTLWAQHFDIPDIHLTQVAEDMLVGGEWFFQELAFKRNEEGLITGFGVSNGRCRNVWFGKLE